MKTKNLFLIFLGFFFIISATLNAQLKQSVTQVAGKETKTAAWKGNEIQFVKRELAVKIKPSFTQKEIDAVLNLTGGKIINSFDKLGWGLIELPDVKDEISAIEDILELSFVITAEPNMVTRADLEPNDPYFKGTSPATYPYQWALKNTSQTPPTGTNDADIDAPEAWNVVTGNSNIILAILDTGIPMLNGSLSHPDLNDPNKIILGPDYINDGNSVKDEYGHGTHVAGIAAAESNNGTGIAGIAWNCKIMPIQVFGAYGGGTWSAFYNGVIYAVDYQRNNPGKKVIINYSGGGSSYSSQAEDAVKYAYDYGVFMSISAGNNYSGPVSYPARFSGYGQYPGHTNGYSNVACVTATDQNDSFSSYSNKGTEVNVSAPGGWGSILDGYVQRFNTTANLGRNIFSTTPNYPFNIQTDPSYAGDPYSTDVTQNYGYLAGTSMAAPQVTGIAGLILSVNPNLTPSQLRDVLQAGADDKGAVGRDDYFGHGRVNAYKSLKYAIENYGGTLPYSINIPADSWNLQQDISVASGATVNIQPNAILTFSSGKKLSVFGTVNTNAATFKGNGSPGYWNSISFYANSSGSIQNSTIRDAQTGIYTTTNANVTVSGCTITNNSLYGLSIIQTSNVTVSNCSISNNGTGINTNSSSITITGNNILYNANYGINANNISSSFYWHHNTMQGNGYAMLLNNASPYIHNNFISANGHGVVISSGMPNFADPSNLWRGYNAITCSATPLFKAQNYSTVYMGYASSGGYNSIFGSELPDMESVNHSGIWACNNYWGGYSPAVYADGTSWIITSTPLGSDPNPGSGCSGSMASLLGKNSYSPSDEGDAAVKYWEAIAQGRNGNLQKAKELFQLIIDGKFDAKYSPLALLNLYEFSTNDKVGLKNTLSVINNRAKDDLLRPFAIRLLARESALSNNNKEMVFYNTELIKNYPSSVNELTALYDLIIYYSETEQDLAKANSYFSRLKEAYPGEDLTLFAGINLGVNLGDLKKETSPEKIPETFYLSDAFPNPFNPTTQIKFSVPKDEFVTLKVYDILGKEVAQLVNEQKSAGTYSVGFDASNLASGIYFYAISAGTFKQINKMILLR